MRIILVILTMLLKLMRALKKVKHNSEVLLAPASVKMGFLDCPEARARLPT